MRALLAIDRCSLGGEDEFERVRNRLRDEGLVLVGALAGEPAEMARFITERRKEADLIVLGGGDAVLDATAEALLGSRLPIAILSLNAGNDLARALGVPKGLEAAARVAATGTPRAIDVARVSGKAFFNAAKIGLGTEVARRLTDTERKRQDVVSYARALTGALRDVRPFKATVKCDGERHRLQSIQIAIGRYLDSGVEEGGGDGRLVVQIVEPMPWWRLITSAPDLYLGHYRGRHNGVTVLRGTRVEVSTDPPMAIYADGEPAGRTPARFTLQSGALRVLVPDTGEAAATLPRDENVLLDEVLVAAQASADILDNASRRIADATLRSPLRALGAERRTAVVALAQEIRRAGELPSHIDPSRQSLKRAVSAVQGVPAELPPEAVLEEAATAERNLQNLLDQVDPRLSSERVRRHVDALRRSVHDSRAFLDKAGSHAP